MVMDKAEFLKILAQGGVAPDSERFSWVGLLADLKEKDEPFTKAQIARETGQPARYVYSHLRDWVQEGKLAKIKMGVENVYLHVDQIPE